MSSGPPKGNSQDFSLELIRDGADFKLYRGKALNGSGPVLVVMPASRSNDRSLERLKQEFSMAGELDARWAARPVAMAHYEGEAVLVLEDPGGEPLDQLLVAWRTKPVGLPRLLRIAVGITRALGQIHLLGMVHKDVKPANILVDASDRVWLTGFGIASQVPQERQAQRPPKSIAGTFAYMAPEQTGRLNRVMDARGDLYSLGVTMYEMLGGRLPFEASDPAEWVHCHVARQPTVLGQIAPELPTVVSAIVMKLLAKPAEERFQTASGLESDLVKCLAELQQTGSVQPFELAQEDVLGPLSFPDKLLDRVEESRAVLEPYHRIVAGGDIELLVVSGYSGVGKSTLVNELYGSLTASQGIYASGKFDQYMQEIPYATCAQAFQKLIQQILSKTDEEVLQWADAFREALGGNGALVVDLVPEFELVVGPQPPVPRLPPKDAHQRFHTALRRFLGVIARPERPLALFLDDLQWADAATLDLVGDLLKEKDVRHLLLIGAYRDNEVDGSHRFRRLLDALREGGSAVTEIHLESLKQDHVTQLVGGALRCPEENVRPLAKIISEKTGGNPFFCIQFLKALQSDRLLYWDRSKRAWAWDVDGILAREHSENVVDLMVESLHRLPDESLDVLQRLACFGSGAAVESLAKVCHTSRDRLHEMLRGSVWAGLIHYSDETYAFQHDRIREAAYSLLPATSQAETHLQIGRELLSRSVSGDYDVDIFQVTGHFNKGLGSAAGPEERRTAARLNLSAGTRAKDAAAYETAISFFAKGQSLLVDDRTEADYALTYSFELQRAECEFLTGQYPAAEQRLTELMSFSDGRVDSSPAICLLIDLNVVLGRTADALQVGLAFLIANGVSICAHPTDLDVQEAHVNIWRLLGSRKISDLLELPEMTDRDIRATAEVLNRLVLSAVYQDANLHKVLIALLVALSIEYGNTAASCVGYISFARMLITDLEDYNAALNFGQLSLDLVGRKGFSAFKARVYFSYGTGISSWASHLRIGREYIQKALDEASRNGDVPYIGYCHSNLVGNLISSGVPLAEADRAADEALQFALRSGSRIAAAFVVGQLSLIRSLSGAPLAFPTFDDEHFDRQAFEDRLELASTPRVVSDIYWSRRLQGLVFQGDFAAALAAAARQKTLFKSPWPNIEGADFEFYAGLAHAGFVSSSARVEDRVPHVSALRTHYNSLEKLASKSSENFECRAALLGAELARLEGQGAEAERLYDRAIRAARANGFRQVEALVYERAANAYEARGLEDIADTYRAKAREAFKGWGAFAILKGEGLPPRGEFGDHASGHEPERQFDAAAFALASQALSGEMLVPRVIERLMQIAIEYAGADRGLLLLQGEGGLRIAAEAVTDGVSVSVQSKQSQVDPSDVPLSLVNYTIRTRKRVILDDALADEIYSKDAYVQARHSRSVLCLLISRQSSLVGALYLENSLTPGAFTPERLAVLDLLAAQAAISLENAVLYTNLQRSETFLSQGQKISRTGSFGWDVGGANFFWSEQLYKILEYEASTVASAELALARVHVDDRERIRSLLSRARAEGRDFDSEHRLVMPDGRIKHVHTIGRSVNVENLDFVGSVHDVTDRVQTEELLRQVRNDLAHVARVTTLNAMTGSIAHEVSQPLSGILTNAITGARLLSLMPPDVAGAAETIRRTIRDANRASDVVKWLRAMFQKQAPTIEAVDLNQATREVIILSSGELHRSGVGLSTEFAEDLQHVLADRVQLQQVILNLLLNAIEAMASIQDRARNITIRTHRDGDNLIQLDLEDTGIGVDPAALDKLFEAFYTTKSNGMGIGLSICRSIIENIDGRLWASKNPSSGMTFSFSIPAVSMNERDGG